MTFVNSSGVAVDDLLNVLQKFWGYDSFRPLQLEAMQSVLQNRDSVVVLPTGGGKSLCFQAPALCQDGLAVVISPLISLMKDQVDTLVNCGIPAAYLNSSLSNEEYRDVMRSVRQGDLQLLYLSPERLVTESTIRFLKEAHVSFIAIDEAHCISEWGHDFRPEYRQLQLLKKEFSNIPIHTYTATATEKVRSDICRNLGLQKPEIFVGSFDRPNLSYRVSRRDNVVQQTVDVIRQHPDESGIIYCIRRKDVETMVSELSGKGYRIRGYHAGLSDVERSRNQNAFIDDEVDLIAATVAFGMGIDKPNVRFVVHTGMPKSLENYQQESGRAGRDGLEADCVLFYSGGDYALWKRMLAELEGDAHQAAVNSLSGIYDYCTGVRCRHRSLIEHFGQKYERENCGACDVCGGALDELDDPLIMAQKIISCVVRLDQRFGADYTTKVLHGSKERRILEQQHDQLSTYGLLANENPKHIRDWVEQLVGQNYLEKFGDYNVLRVTGTGRELLRGERTPKLLKPHVTVKKSRKNRDDRFIINDDPSKTTTYTNRGDDWDPVSSKKKNADKVTESWEGVDKRLFERLRDLRHEKSQERNVPAYIVFGDATLREMARDKPKSLDEFLEIRGVGEKKRDDYGEEFVQCIIAYCEEYAD